MSYYTSTICFLCWLILSTGSISFTAASIEIEVNPLRTTTTTAPLAPVTPVEMITNLELTTSVSSTKSLLETTSVPITTSAIAMSKENVTVNQTTTINTLLNSTGVTSTTSAPTTAASNVTKSFNDVNSTQVSVVNKTLINETLNFLSSFTKRKLRANHLLASYYCPCDLKINFCDVNCCCDMDCTSAEVRQTFKCDDQNLGMHDYEDTFGLESCSVSDTLSLLCVVDRKPSTRKDHYNKQIEIDFKTAVKYNWINRLHVEPVKAGDFWNFYKAGDQILAWNEVNKNLRALTIPRSLSGNKCEIESAIKHLTDTETKCLHTIEEHERFISDIEEKLKQLKILKTPPILPISVLTAQDICNNANATATNKNESSLNCVEIEIYHCYDLITAKSCMSNMTDFDTLDNLWTKDIQIKFQHNFTSIISCVVFFVYTTHSEDEQWSNGNILQTIGVKFLEFNESYADRSVHRISGNIGYLPHNPVLVSKFLTINRTNEKNDRVLSYFHENITFFNDDHFLKIPKLNKNGNCIINNNSYNTINFGENIFLRCKAVFPKFINFTEPMEAPVNNNIGKTDSEQNLTSLCRFYQTTIFSYLIHRLDQEQENSTVLEKFNVHVSEFGNPRNETGAWIRLKNADSPVKLDDIVGVDYDENLNTFICKNMYLNVRYEFFFGRLRVVDIAHQALIKESHIKFGPKIDLKFKIDADLQSIPIFLDVMFHDFTQAVLNKGQKAFSSTTIIFISILIAAYNLSICFERFS